jgi:hypothetical protein
MTRDDDMKFKHIFEAVGFSETNKCFGHVWEGEGRCPYCSDSRLGSDRNKEIIARSLEILENILMARGQG